MLSEHIETVAKRETLLLERYRLAFGDVLHNPEPQPCEKVDQLLISADGFKLQLTSLVFNLKLTLAACINRWTACVTHWPYALGSGMLTPALCLICF
jgi:hypothetical protein